MRKVLTLCLVVALALMVAASPAAAAVQKKTMLKASDFQNISMGGFGDPHNSYMWSMAEFNGDVYVGTGRLVDTFSPMWENICGVIMPGVRPPELPGVPWTPFIQDFLTRPVTVPAHITSDTAYAAWNAEAHAEIWRYRNGQWARVWVAADVPSVLLNEADVQTKTAEITGLRSMSTYTDKNGLRALYATAGGLNFAVQSTLLLRTTDGTTWQRLLTPPGMTRQSRATFVHSGKLYVGTEGSGSGASALPGGTVWVSQDPGAGRDSWQKVLDFNEAGWDAGNDSVLCMASYNDRLYVGTRNTQGFQVYRSTVASPTSNADWVRVITDGAGDRYNTNAQSMKVFEKQLYIGTLGLPAVSGYYALKGFDILRIDKNDNWKLLVGNATPVVPVTEGAVRTVESQWPSGFGNPMNFYCWSLEEYDGHLYAGSFDALVFLRYLEDANEYYGLQIPPELIALSQSPEALALYGADLWATKDGIGWTPVSLNGLGDIDNYGFRNLKSIGGWLYVGTSNPWTGGQIWRGTTLR